MADQQPKTERTALDSSYFDRWYADMETSPTKDAILQRHLEVPSWLGSVGVLHWDAITEITGGLRLSEGAALVDVACGRGGYGIEVARRSGAALVGVDFSAVALVQARAIAERHLQAGRAHFRLGTLTATGLATGSADALMCTDSVDFAEPPLAAVQEFARVLRRGGRLAVTSWRAARPEDPSVSARLRRRDLARDLTAAGFLDVVVQARPAWLEAERGVWQEASAIAEEEQDAALRSLRDEGRRSLETLDTIERVIAFATAPWAHHGCTGSQGRPHQASQNS